VRLFIPPLIREVGIARFDPCRFEGISSKPTSLNVVELENRSSHGGCHLRGFLSTQAGFGADLNLLIQIAMGITLVVGAFLARTKRYKAHGICQSTVLFLNLVLIFSVMWPSFRLVVLPGLPKHLERRYYAIATIHGVLGAVAELLGLYIILVAGTDILPQAWRFERWKLWMRIELALWIFVLITGIGTYVIWYAVAL
jgi:uncharacterized membrane protein YozB (DUF420 family)